MPGIGQGHAFSRQFGPEAIQRHSIQPLPERDGFDYTQEIWRLFSAVTKSRFQICLVHSLDQVWKEFLDQGESLLNLEHNYIP